MSHTQVHHGIQFTYNSDLSGDVTLTQIGGSREISVPGAALTKFIASHGCNQDAFDALLAVAKASDDSDSGVYQSDLKEALAALDATHPGWREWAP